MCHELRNIVRLAPLRSERRCQQRTRPQWWCCGRYCRTSSGRGGQGPACRASRAANRQLSAAERTCDSGGAKRQPTTAWSTRSNLASSSSSHLSSPSCFAHCWLLAGTACGTAAACGRPVRRRCAAIPPRPGNGLGTTTGKHVWRRLTAARTARTAGAPRRCTRSPAASAAPAAPRSAEGPPSRSACRRGAGRTARTCRRPSASRGPGSTRGRWSARASRRTAVPRNQRRAGAERGAGARTMMASPARAGTVVTGTSAPHGGSSQSSWLGRS